MTTYNATKMAAGIQPKVLLSAAGVAVLSLFTPAVALVLNDIINMVSLEGDPGIPVAFGPTIMGVSLDSDQLDSNGGPTMKFDVGDATGAARFITQTTIPQTGGLQGANVAGTLGYQPFSATYNNYPTASLQIYTVQVKVHTAPATWQAGTIRLKVEYSYDP